MKNKQNNEPGDEFDRIMIPEFLARPFERLGGRPLPAAPAGRPGSPADTDPTSPPDADGGADPDAASADDEQPAPRAWWAGYRGKLVLYGAGTLVMVFLQSRS
jgi:hypothetical protein